MDERLERLKKKYSGFKVKEGKKQMNFATNKAHQREKAISAHGKPKNTWNTIKRLFAYLKKERFLFFLAIGIAIINTASTLIASYMLRPIINNYIFYNIDDTALDERYNALFVMLSILALIYLIAVLTQWLQSRIMLSVSQRALTHMRSDLYQKLMSLPMRYFDSNQAGDIMSRFTNDTDTVSEMLNTTLIQIISGVITIVGTLTLMMITNWILGLITVIATPLLTLISKGIIKYGRIYYKTQQRNLGILNGFTEETITGEKVVKVFNHEEIAEYEFAYLNKEYANSQIKAQFCSGIMGPATHQVCNLIYAITACVGGLLVIYQGFDIGGLTVSLNYTRRFNRPINDISMQVNTVFSALAGAERIFQVMDEEKEYKESETTYLEKIEGKVEVFDVDFSYIKGLPVLHDITLYAKKGQKVAFVGATGAGKTTITNLLPKFYEIEKGSILIDGVNINKINRKFLRENIAMVLQDTHLFTGTVMENIRYGRLDATDEEVISAAKAVCAHDFIIHLENGYNTLLENDGANLSQGQRQLLNIARAAVSKAPILVLDEATSSIDTRTEKMIDMGMDHLMKDRTTFVIAHRLSTVRSANVIMVLDKGRIIERGTHEELLNMKGRYAALYNELIELD